jgi:hypothetical protein
MRGPTVFPVLLLAVGGVVWGAIGEGQRIGKPHPTVFAPDRNNLGFEGAGPPSDAVLDALLKTKEATADSNALEGRSRETLRQMFEVVKVDLGDRNEMDYVALGNGPMTGADCFWFWIVRVRQGQADVLLFSNGLSLVLRKHTTNGYRDIEGDWATASFIGETLYRYNGSVYRLEWEHTKENN